jgi:hypothetical protein
MTGTGRAGLAIAMIGGFACGSALVTHPLPVVLLSTGLILAAIGSYLYFK